MRTKRTAQLGVTLGACLLLIAGCAKRPADPAADANGASVGVPVEVVAARVAPMTRAQDLTGTIRASTDATVSVSYGARVTGVYARDGDKVAAGQVLVRMDAVAAQARLQQALGALSAAQAQAASAQSAFATEQVTSPSRLQEAQAALVAAQSRLAALRAGARSQERAMAESAVAAAKSSLDRAAADLQRAEMLSTQGAASQQQLDIARNAHQLAAAQYRSAQEQLSLIRAGARSEDLQAAEAGVRQAQAAVASARAGLRSVDISRMSAQTALANLQQAEAAVESARNDVANTVVRSPVSGVVYARMVDVGNVPGVGTALMQVADTRQVYFEATVPARDFPKLAVGQTVSVRVDALPGATFSGRLERLVPVADRRSRDFLARIAVANPDLRLRPGMFARGTVVLERRAQAIVVPSEALVERNGAPSLFIVRNGKATERKVMIGLETATLTELLTGVAAGDQVVTTGQSALKSGQPVNVIRQR